MSTTAPCGLRVESGYISQRFPELDLVVIKREYDSHVISWTAVAAVPNRLYGATITPEGDAI